MLSIVFLRVEHGFAAWMPLLSSLRMQGLVVQLLQRKWQPSTSCNEAPSSAGTVMETGSNVVLLEQSQL